MGIEAIYRHPNTFKPAPGHKIYPYLRRKLAVTRLNQVWAMGLTYIPMARVFVYLCGVVDWFSGTFVVASVDYDGGAGSLWKAGNLQYGPGVAVHLH